MATWKSTTLSSMLPADDIEPILTASENAVTALESAATTLSAAAALMKAQVIDAIDPVRATLEALIQEIENFVSDYLAQGGYMLVVPPKLYGDRSDITSEVIPSWWPISRSMDEFVTEVSQSVYDFADPNRPRFTESALVGGIVMIVSATPTTPDSLLSFIEAVEAFVRYPYLSEIKKIANTLKDGAVSAFEDVITPPPEVTYVDKIELSPRSEPKITLRDASSFLPVGHLWIGRPGTRSGSGRWRSNFPVFYSRREGRVLYLDPAQASIAFNPEWEDGRSVPQVGDWAVPSDGYLPLSHLTFRSRSPDWNKLVAMSHGFGASYDVALHLNRIAAAARVGTAVTDSIDKLSTLVQNRIDYMSDTISSARTIVDAFSSATLGTGVSYLIIEESDGVDGFLTELINAGNRPDFGDEALSVGLVLLGGVAGVQAVKAFLFSNE